MYKSIKIEAKATFWYTLCNILQKGVSFLFVPIYVRILSTAEYGRYTVFLSWRDILLIFATFNLFYGVYTKFLVEFSDDRDILTSSMQGLCSTITMIFSALLIINNITHIRLLDYDNYLQVLLIMYYLFVPSYMFWTARMRVEYKYVRMVIVTLAVSVAIPLCSLILIYKTNLRESGVIIGNLIVQTVAGIFCYINNFIKGRVFYNKNYWFKALKFNVPLIPYYLSTMVLGQSDRIMIEKYDGSDNAGIYSLAYQVSFILNVVTDAINASMTPWFYSRLKDKSFNTIKKISSSLLVAVVIMVFFVMLAAPDIVYLLGTEEYYQAVWIIPSVASCVYIIFAYNLVVNIEFFYDMPYFITITTLTGAGLNLLLNKSFIPVYGYVVAGYTTAASYFIVFILHYVLYGMLLKKKMDGNSPLSVKHVYVFCFMVICMAGFSLFLYSCSVGFRYLFLLLILILMIFNRNKIKSLFVFLKSK